MGLNLDNHLGLHPKALAMFEKRAEILSNNIANESTPGFKAQDVDFREALNSEKQRTTGALSLNTPKDGHLANRESLALEFLKFRTIGQPDISGNTVDVNIEQGQFAENAIRYQAALRFTESKFESIASAISGGRR